MTKDFETLLYLFGDSTMGRESRIKNIENPDKVIEMSAKQGIWSCIYPVLSNVCDISKYQMDFLLFVSKGIARNEFTLNIIAEAMKKGIDICILKGVAVASLYANPDCRISSDTDILISKKDESKMTKYLQSKGYEVKKRRKNDHHMKATHKVGGLLEVHISLNSKIEDEFAFGRIFKYDEVYVPVKIGKDTFYTLGINDNLYFLTSHYIRHFISGGSSIRQIMDLLVYIEKNKERIDFEKYYKTLKILRYDKLIKTIMAIGNKYFGMNFENAEDEYMELILNDCENCGLFGSNSVYSTGVIHQFYAGRNQKSSLKMKFWFWFKAENSVFSRLFPSQDELVQNGYHYSHNKFLIPVAWIHRFFKRIFSRKKNSKIRSANPELISRRIEIMRNLSVID